MHRARSHELAALAATAALAALGAACAAAPAARIPFAEAQPWEPPDEPEPAPASPMAAPAPPLPPIDPVLLRFSADARQARAALPRSHGFPEERVAAWSTLDGDLAPWLAGPGDGTSLQELLRARVTLEAELDLDRRHFGAPPRELAARLEERLRRLDLRMQAARGLGQRLFATGAPPALRWPLGDAGVSSGFGPRLDPLDHSRRMHWGIDLAAAQGRVVTAAAPGYVVQAEHRPGYGLVVEVRHPGDLTSRYGHLSALLCAPGDPVEAGQPLGLVGATGRATGPHLHFEIWRGGHAEDPLALLGGGGAGGSP